MPPLRSRGRALAIGSVAALALGAATLAFSGAGSARSELGLLTTLPIYWAETFDIGAPIDDESEPHWVRAALEREYDLVPLDTLDNPELDGIGYLLLAQPRALSPEENVALDRWVRAGGRVLIFADPFLTEESLFHIGDRRRPQDVILLSPILRRWGLELRFDPEQPDGEHMVDQGGRAVPVNLAGTLVPVEGSAPSECRIEGEGLMARCLVGQGEVTVFADAAVLEQDREGQARTLLDGILSRAFKD